LICTFVREAKIPNQSGLDLLLIALEGQRQGILPLFFVF
jgi:hypothetical protein